MSNLLSITRTSAPSRKPIPSTRAVPHWCGGVLPATAVCRGRGLAGVALAALALLVALPADAQTAYTRASSGNWSDSNGWSPIGVPAAGDSADINGRTVTLDIDPTVATLLMPSAASMLNGSGDLTITGTLDWQGGRMEGAGTTLVQAAATMTISGDDAKGVRFGRIVRNEGTGTWSGSGQFSNGGDAEMVNVGSLAVSAGRVDGTALFFGDTFSNSGSLTVNTGSIANFSSFFHNSGTVAVDGGTLTLRGFNSDGGTDSGGYTVAAGATLVLGGGSRSMSATSSIGGDGTVEVHGGTTHLSGPYDVQATRLQNVNGAGVFHLHGASTTGTLEIVSGTLAGAGTLQVTEGLTWDGGSMRGSGTTVLGAGLPLDLDTANVSLSDSRTLVLQGATSWSGSVSISNGSQDVTVVSTGTFTSSGSGTRQFFAGTFSNEGSFVHDGGTLTFTSRFDNEGLVQVQAGTMRLAGFNAIGGTDTGHYAIAADAALEFTGGTRVLTGSAILSGNGIVAHVAGSLSNSAMVAPGASPGTLTWMGTGPYAPLAGGLLEIEIAGSTPGLEHDVLAVEDDAVLGGALDVSLAEGFEPASGDQFVVLTATGGVTGSFATTQLPPGYAVVYEPGEVRIVAGEPDVHVFSDGFETLAP